MPLHKRKPFPLLELPRDLDPDELVFQVRFTKEIFRDYREYLNRLNLYRQKVWTCKFTGKSNLTYEEALVSEHRATEKVQQFPKEQVAPVLSMIQYSMLSLKDLVDKAYCKLQAKLLEGTELYGRKEQSVHLCKVIKVLEDGDSTSYQVGWLDKDNKITNTSVVNAQNLIFKKPLVTRSMLKSFIRESTTQSIPWVVHEKLAKMYGVSTDPPEELRGMLTIQNGYLRKSKEKRIGGRNDWKRESPCDDNLADLGMIKKRKKIDHESVQVEPIKYPIDDLLVQPGADDPIFTERPGLSTYFAVPMDCVGDLMMVWSFCSSFSRLLNLWPFSLEAFENAVCHKESDLVLIAESCSAILRLFMKEEGEYFMAVRNKKRKPKIILSNWMDYLCDFLEMEDKSELSCHVTTIKRGHYGLLDTRVKLSIFRELVEEAILTDAIRSKLNVCAERQQALAATKRGAAKKQREEQQLKKESNDIPEINELAQRQVSENGKGYLQNLRSDEQYDGQDTPKEEIQNPCSYKGNHVRENGVNRTDVANCREISNRRKRNNEGCKKKPECSSGAGGSMKEQRKGKDKDKEQQEKKPEELQKERLEREMEKLSIRINCLGKDKHYNRYWFFRREGRLFVESSDSTQWGYYTTKEELDALLGSLNPKGERERALKRQLEKYYIKISTALQKRSKDIAVKVLVEEGVLRRSTRVRAQPRGSQAMAFLRYTNKWKDN